LTKVKRGLQTWSAVDQAILPLAWLELETPVRVAPDDVILAAVETLHARLDHVPAGEVIGTDIGQFDHLAGPLFHQLRPEDRFPARLGKCWRANSDTQDAKENNAFHHDRFI
jgi:hypothetical protein